MGMWPAADYGKQVKGLLSTTPHLFVFCQHKISYVSGPAYTLPMVNNHFNCNVTARIVSYSVLAYHIK